MSWREFWNADTPIYVNERHKRVHYRRIAQDIARLVPGQAARVVDYGCGETLNAADVARLCTTLVLCDGAETVRMRLTERYAAFANITVVSPEEFAEMANASADLIVVNSLLQYLSRAELERVLAVWRDKLAPGGRLVLADVIPPDIGPLTDAAALLRFAAANGFLVPAFFGLVRTYFSDYRRVRAELGLAHYDAAELIAILGAHGFTAERLAQNFGHNAARMAFVARAAREPTPAG